MNNFEILKTEDSSLKFIAYDGYEEYYLEEDRGLVGLRPNTETELREFARNTDIEDYVGGEIPYFLEKYIDRNAFADDMEGAWDEQADIRTERVEDGKETVYLCWGSSSSLKYQFNRYGILTYEDFVNYYDIVGITEDEFNNLDLQ